MVLPTDFIVDIDSSKESWHIVARVVRLWKIPNFHNAKIPLALEMVLCDERGGKIHAVVRRTLVYKFQSTLIEGAAYSISNFGVGENSGEFKYSMHLYKVNFEYHTRVVLMRDCTIPRFQFSFVSLADVMAPSFDNNYLVDVIRVLTGIGTEKEYERNRKKFRMNVMELEIDGFGILIFIGQITSKIEYALFENYLDDLNAFLASGNTTNVIVVVQLAKVKSFKGKVSLQNSLHATKLIFNPDFEKAVELRKRLEENIESVSQPLSQIAEVPKLTMKEEFLTHTVMKTIEELKDSNEECCCIVMATIKHLIEGEDWWYRLKVRVIDTTDSATLVIFDRDAASLLNISCYDLLESTAQPNDKSFPAEISALVDQTFLFKVENKIVSNSRFETSYKVRRVCSDSELIQQFKDIHFSKKTDDSLDYVISDSQQLVGVDLSNDLPKQDFLTQLSQSVNDDGINTVLMGTGDGEGLAMDYESVTPCKRNSAECSDEPIDASSSVKLKKVIKQEKE
ncbi:Nucleic acid-binding, OB-fold [Sesbania bispinosa]|nr:Nucleic acid-binding, OB-fold [Sesbania bispinosa]